MGTKDKRMGNSLSQPPFPLERIEEMTALMGGDGCLYMK